jgi:hypothetical protein
LATNTITSYLENVILDLIYGGVSYTSPATLYVAVHVASTLSAAASVGATTISVADAMPVGSTIILNPGAANTETRTIGNLTGTGPYTVTLAAATTGGAVALAQAHTISEPVTFDPSDAGGNIKEPVGGGYARVAVANNPTNFPAAVDGVKSNGVTISWPTATASWGMASHSIVFDSATGGNAMSVHVATTPIQVNTGTTLSLPIGTGLRATLE